MPPQNNDQVPQNTGFSTGSVQPNNKLTYTVKVFIVYSSILSLLNVLIGILISFMRWSPNQFYFGIGGIVSSIVVGAIGGLIGGVMFYYLFDPVRNWVKKSGFLSRHLDTLFNLFWKPFLLGMIISGAFGILGVLGLSALAVSVGSSFVGLLLGFVISFVAQIAFYYWYAKTMTAKLSTYYSW